MPVQVKIDPTTGLTKCGNSIEREDGIQILFSTVYSPAEYWWGFGIPNVLRNAWQLLQFTMKNKGHKYQEVPFHPHAYWSVDNRPKGTKQIVDSGLFTYLFGEKKGAPLKEMEEYCELYIDFVNNHFKKYCKTDNTPWFVELDLHGRYSLEDYHRMQKKLFDSCPNRDFIGVWHCQHGLKQLEELCERFDYIAMGSGFSASSVESKIQGIRWLATHHPEKCIHWLGTDNINNLLAPGCVHNLCDTCDSTGWISPRRFGLEPDAKLRELAAPAIQWCNDNWFKWFPKAITKNPRSSQNPLSGLSDKNMEGSVWSACKVQHIWSYFDLFSPQKKYDKGAMRGVVKKILEGKGAELDVSDITEPLYEFELGCCCGQKLYFPKGYKDAFESGKIDRMSLAM